LVTTQDSKFTHRNYVDCWCNPIGRHFVHLEPNWVNPTWPRFCPSWSHQQRKQDFLAANLTASLTQKRDLMSSVLGRMIFCPQLLALPSSIESCLVQLLHHSIRSITACCRSISQSFDQIVLLDLDWTLRTCVHGCTYFPSPQTFLISISGHLPISDVFRRRGDLRVGG
jgi:hypothetical protein